MVGVDPDVGSSEFSKFPQLRVHLPSPLSAVKLTVMVV